jgi:hypothetical protein
MVYKTVAGHVTSAMPNRAHAKRDREIRGDADHSHSSPR